MEIIFLGTGGVNGIPAWLCSCKVCTIAKTEKGKNVRTRSSIIVKSGDKTVLVDMGPDLRFQIQREKISKVDHVLVTHSHIDHTASLVDLGVSGKTILEMPRKVLDFLKEERKWFEAYIKKRNPEVVIRAFKPEKVGLMNIDAVELLHAKDFTNIIPPCYGYLFEEKGFRVAYLSDFNKIIDKEKVKDVDLLICDSGPMKTGKGHIGIDGGIELYKELKPKKMLFTHVPHYILSHEELEKYVKKHGNIGIAWDGLRIKS